MAIFGSRAAVPWKIRRNLRWPGTGNLYIEFARAIILDRTAEGEPEELMHGTTVAEGKDPREVTSITTCENQ